MRRTIQRLRVIPVSRENRAIRSLRIAENGAEFGVLEALANAVLSKKEIDPFFQKVVNAIVMKAVLVGKLPSKKKGRPGAGCAVSPGWDIACKYFSLVDSGMSYEDSVAEVAKEFHKDERTIMRHVKANKVFIGTSIQQRQRTRYRESNTESVEYTLHPLSDPEEVDQLKNFSVEKADEFINDVLSTGDPPVIK